MKEQLKNILTEIRYQSEKGNRKGLTAALRQVMDNRLDYYHESIVETLEEEFADALYKILLLEMDEEEEESIQVAELAYLSLGNALKQAACISPDQYKRRLLLLHYFCDYFTDAIIEVFLSQYKQENRLQARSLALECLEKMQLSDMFCLEEQAPDFMEGDEQLIDACNAIEISPHLSTEEKLNAALLHKVLYAYLKAKYKN